MARDEIVAALTAHDITQVAADAALAALLPLIDNINSVLDTATEAVNVARDRASTLTQINSAKTNVVTILSHLWGV